jgi:hypothetical protein
MQQECGYTGQRAASHQIRLATCFSPERWRASRKDLLGFSDRLTSAMLLLALLPVLTLLPYKTGEFFRPLKGANVDWALIIRQNQARYKAHHGISDEPSPPV